MDLVKRSVAVILDNQFPSGAYIASPTFATYHYCWFRDGSFIAYAMDLVEQYGSAGRFHDWVAEAINRRSALIQSGLAKLAAGEPMGPADVLHTRYTLDGEDGTKEEWPNFQLDGFGTWLWALQEHVQHSGTPLKPAWKRAADQVVNYLTAIWSVPCYDCWEEFPDLLHPYTLAAIYGGLKAYGEMTGSSQAETMERIRGLVLERAVTEGAFVKSIGRQDVDASLLGLALPYGLVSIDDPRFVKTVQRIEASLRGGGGVHRYATDTYFGGGEWVLLTAWLGWYYAAVGRMDQARETLHWIEAQADASGNLPEQVPLTLNDPNYYQPWVERWGPVARPLLWSHANYLILAHALGIGH